MAKCTTGWTLTFSKPSATPAVVPLGSFGQFRCDNAVSGKVAGCVVPWAPEVVWFSKATAPNLVSHVIKAQASGLPGAVNQKALTRMTSTVNGNTNRYRACSGSPSIAGYSCDEYPFKSTYNGLYAIPDWQNWRRSFTGCQWPALVNGQTGSKGVSACMVPVPEQNYQGGTIGDFYKAWRVLDGDPLYVGTTA